MTTSHALNNNSHIDYRPDIDGLRALAIIAVVIFHASPLRLRGGFVGVDIFFVLSGYLITSIILKGLANNSFSFVDFYARRIRRIFPALSVVLAACLAFGWFALLADEYMQLGKHIAGGAGFISNFVLWREVGYFDNAAETKPLLHLWSLGIEEQFYFIWPLLLWFAWKKRLNSLSITIGVVLLSFIACTVALKSNATAAFYAPWNRFWELCCGAALAHVMTFHQDWLVGIKAKANGYLNRVVYRNSVDGSNETLNHALSVIGFLLLVASFIAIHKGRSFPGKWALMPVIGSVLIIVAGRQAYINRKILSNKLLVWVGLISYPLYLWHWPLLSFARIVEGETPSHLIRWGAVAIAVLLSWLTYKFVENPLRFGRFIKSKTIALIGIMGLLGGIGFLAFLNHGFPNRTTDWSLGYNPQQVSLDLKEPEKTRGSDGTCLSKLGLNTPPGTVCLTNSSEPQVLIIGDSHAMALNSAAHLNRINLESLLVSAHSCLPFKNTSLAMPFEQPQNCVNVYENTFKAIQAFPSIETIIINTRGPSYLTGHGYGIEITDTPKTNTPKTNKDIQNSAKRHDYFYTEYSSLVQKLLSFGKKVVFVIDVPELGVDIKTCLARPLSISKKSQDFCEQQKSEVLARQKSYREIVQKLKKDHPKLIVYDSLNRFCDDTKCHGIIDGKIMYFDDDHLSISGSKFLLEDLIQVIGTR